MQQTVQKTQALTHFKNFACAIGLAKAALRRDSFAEVEKHLSTARTERSAGNKLVPGLVRRTAMRALNERLLMRRREVALMRDREAFAAAERLQQERKAQAERELEQKRLQQEKERREIAYREQLAKDHAFIMEVASCFGDTRRRCHLCLLRAAELCAKHSMPRTWKRRIEEMDNLLTKLRERWGVIQLCTVNGHRRHVDLITRMIKEAEERDETPSYETIVTAIQIKAEAERAHRQRDKSGKDVRATEAVLIALQRLIA